MTKNQTANYLKRVLTAHNSQAVYPIDSLTINYHKDQKIYQYIVAPDIENNIEKGGE